MDEPGNCEQHEKRTFGKPDPAKPTPRPMQVFGKPGLGNGAVLFRAMTACDCGCGLKNRFEFMVGRDIIWIDDPAAIKALIDEMSAGFKLLFPDASPVPPKSMFICEQDHE